MFLGGWRRVFKTIVVAVVIVFTLQFFFTLCNDGLLNVALFIYGENFWFVCHCENRFLRMLPFVSLSLILRLTLSRAIWKAFEVSPSAQDKCVITNTTESSAVKTVAVGGGDSIRDGPVLVQSHHHRNCHLALNFYDLKSLTRNIRTTTMEALHHCHHGYLAKRGTHCAQSQA